MEWEGFIILKHRIFLFCFGGGVCSQNYTRPLPTLLLRWLLSGSGEYFFQDVVYKAKNHTLIVLVYVRGKKLGRKPIRGNRRNNLLAANVFSARGSYKTDLSCNWSYSQEGMPNTARVKAFQKQFNDCLILLCWLVVCVRTKRNNLSRVCE